MISKLSDLIIKQAEQAPKKTAIIFKDEEMTYGTLGYAVAGFGRGLVASGLYKGDRVATYLPKQMETVVSIFGASYGGGVFVPVNPVLKPQQVFHILKDCAAKFLVTSADRLVLLKDHIADLPQLELIIVMGEIPVSLFDIGNKVINYSEFMAQSATCNNDVHDTADHDLAAILYTSGSTGLPKGVMLSHANMTIGASSVSSYLKQTNEDRILSVLPLSFDAGLSQLTTGFYAGATVILMNYLLPRDVLRQAEKHKATAITFVPPLLIQLGDLEWPQAVVDGLRYIATTGGRMPVPVIEKLRTILSKSDIYLMYGLTEAFRSTYLPPSEIDRIPNSIGKAIPNVEIMVVREDGTACEVEEEGELVHLGPLVGLGYWNDPERTKERYKPIKRTSKAKAEIAVWSGDTVKKDKQGFLYFVGRRDDMIKTSGFRVSPNEIEAIIQASGYVQEVVAMGLFHDQLGHEICVVATPSTGEGLDIKALMAYCRGKMPSYMVPRSIIERQVIPKNANGKIDRKLILSDLNFKEEDV